jgi:hypothetical protein
MVSPHCQALVCFLDGNQTHHAADTHTGLREDDSAHFLHYFHDNRIIFVRMTKWVNEPASGLGAFESTLVFHRDGEAMQRAHSLASGSDVLIKLLSSRQGLLVWYV